MPVLESTYTPPRIYQRDIATIRFARSAPPMLLRFHRQRLECADGDFIDLDRVKIPNAPRIILLHGLEGSSQSPYIQRFGAAFLAEGWSILALNFKGCSGTPNRFPGSYHSGASDQVREVVEQLEREDDSLPIALVAVSLGANVALNYLAEEPTPLVIGGVAFSVPCDLAGCSAALGRPRNFLYQFEFVRSLRQKLREKARQFPGALREEQLERSRSIGAIDENFTAPLHGFSSAAEYYARCSSGPKLHRVRVPTLIVNALDDPFLSAKCFPFEAAEQNSKLNLECPRKGGHVAFPEAGGGWWPERRAKDFLKELFREPQRAR
jgi:predicted alpha/beta-fold hydrolase